MNSIQVYSINKLFCDWKSLKAAECSQQSSNSHREIVMQLNLCFVLFFLNLLENSIIKLIYLMRLIYLVMSTGVYLF